MIDSLFIANTNMALFQNASAPGGVLSQVQELIATYITSLEKTRLEECSLIFQEAEEAKKLLSIIEEKIAVAQEATAILSVKEESLHSSIKSLEKSRDDVAKQEMLCTEQYIKRMQETTELEQKHTKLDDEILRLSEERDTINEQNKKLNNEQDRLADLLSQRVAYHNSLHTDIQNKAFQSDELDEQLAVKHLALAALEEQEKTISATNQQITDLSHQLAEKFAQEKIKFSAIAKEKAAQELSLITLKEQVEKVKSEIEEERQVIENEKIFIKECNDVISQNSKSISYTKEKLKEIVSKVAVVADEAKATELKSLLFVIEKL